MAENTDSGNAMADSGGPSFNGPESAAPEFATPEFAAPEPTAPEFAMAPQPPTSIPTPTPTPTPKKQIKGRTLVIGAVALGIVGGLVAGYTIQLMRDPTPLPSLVVAQPRYPVSPVFDGSYAPGLPAKQDDEAITDGDLTKLLLPTPKGATVGAADHEWWSLADGASLCDDPASCFSTDVSDGVARIADTSWRTSDGLYVEIRMYQYRPGSTLDVDGEIADYAPSGDAKAIPMPDGIASAGYEYRDDNNENDDHTVAVHGDLVVYFWVTSKTHVPNPSIIDGLMTQQMARL